MERNVAASRVWVVVNLKFVSIYTSNLLRSQHKKFQGLAPGSQKIRVAGPCPNKFPTLAGEDESQGRQSTSSSGAISSAGGSCGSSTALACESVWSELLKGNLQDADRF